MILDETVESLTKYFMGSKVTICWIIIIFHLINNIKGIIYSIVHYIIEKQANMYKNYIVTVRVV